MKYYHYYLFIAIFPISNLAVHRDITSLAVLITLAIPIVLHWTFLPEIRKLLNEKQKVGSVE